MVPRFWASYGFDFTASFFRSENTSQRPIHATPTGSIGGNQPLMKNAKLPCPDNSLRTPANAQLVINLLHVPFYRTLGQTQPVSYLPIEEAARSEKRRLGKECVSQCRSRWSTDTSKKKKKEKQ